MLLLSDGKLNCQCLVTEKYCSFYIFTFYPNKSIFVSCHLCHSVLTAPFPLCQSAAFQSCSQGCYISTVTQIRSDKCFLSFSSFFFFFNVSLFMFDVGLVGDKANHHSKTPDVYSFDEDSSDALSPEQPSSQETPSSTSASLRESGGTDATSASCQLNSPKQVNHCNPLQFLRHELSSSWVSSSVFSKTSRVKVEHWWSYLMVLFFICVKNNTLRGLILFNASTHHVPAMYFSQLVWTYCAQLLFSDCLSTCFWLYCFIWGAFLFLHEMMINRRSGFTVLTERLMLLFVFFS